jgi:lipopolysaccharide/colanic/teichoic acid biosynthesis glycosyltransferase
MKIGGQRIPGKTLVLIASEAALIACGLVFATALRFMDAAAFRGELNHSGVLLRYGIVILICELALYYYDLYDLQVVSRRSVLFVRLLQALGTACLGLAMLYYWYPELSLGRGIAAVAAPVIVCLVSGWRLIVDASAPLLRRNERILIVGDGVAGYHLTEEILRRPELNIDIVGILSDRTGFGSALASDADYTGGFSPLPAQYSLRYNRPKLRTSSSGALMMGSLSPAAVLSGAATAVAEAPAEVREFKLPSVLGTPADVERRAESERVDRVVLALSERRGSMPIKELLQLKFLGMKIEEAHDVYERVTGRILLDHLSPSWLILADGFRKSRLVLAAKRAVDIFASAVGIILAAPIMLLVALAIYLESGGPVLFRQERIGLHGTHFQILKFRSMRNEPTPQAASWTSDEDPRITRVGKFIRKFRLDELPQMINVLRGDMSLVGPRPEQPTLAAMLEEQLPYYRQRHSMRPGITGWAQVKYGYGATVEQTKIKLEHDLFYIKHLSLPLDLAIIFETAKVLLSGRGAK